MVAAINSAESGNLTYEQYRASCNFIISSHRNQAQLFAFLAKGERTSHERIPHNVYSWWPLIPYISRLIVAWRRDLAFSRFSSYRNHIWYHSSRSERLGIMNCHFLSMRVP